MSERYAPDLRIRRLLVDEAPTERRIGKYRVVRELGYGGMAVVYEAVDPDLRRRVALKVLRTADSSLDLAARLYREAAIAGRLRHPNIVGIHEVAWARDEEGRPLHFIAMDYVEGRTLAEVLREDKTDPRELVRMLEDVARAVAYAHSKGIVHRDLKPSNVLVEKGGRILLTDFGLARDQSFHTKLTQSHAVLGTPQYMAPEQVQGKTREIDRRTDVHALGILLYEVLTGAPPFCADTPARLYQRIVDEEPPRPCRRTRSLPQELEIVCLKAMQKRRALRYADAAEFAEELARIRRGEPVRARPISNVARLWRRIVRHRAIVFPAAAAVLVGSLSVLWGILGSIRSRDLEESNRILDQAATLLVPLQRRAIANPSARSEGSEVEGEAERKILRAIGLHPKSARAWDLLGQLRQCQGRHEEAAGHFSEAIGLDPGYWEAFLHRAIAEARCGNFEGALADADEAIRLNPRSAACYLNRGLWRLERKDPAGAVADLTESLRIEPMSAPAYAQRAAAREAMGDSAGALEDAAKAIEINPRVGLSMDLPVLARS